ncbi:MAG TPA: DNA topoisomerase I [Candidatus Baltobacteraceae bacterium]|nr:DNA topoisomerase I [Candidatus Baltobacteraceae bacterium]
MNILIIAEKPSVALRIAMALGNDNQRKVLSDGVSYYEIKEPKNMIYIAAAVGHVFTIHQADKERNYPVLNVEWAASYKVNAKSDYTKKYLDVFVELAPKVDMFINACDYDTEGTVIGTNIIKFVGGKEGEKKAKRMKFSTTTVPDLKESYAHLMPLDVGNFKAGEARHILDWLWGINLSRALTSAISANRFTNALSIGRVQGPTLAILAKREIEIGDFVPSPFWRISSMVEQMEFLNTRGDMKDYQVAQKALDASRQEMKSAVVKDIESTEQSIKPFPPFDLTTLQLEAAKAFRLDPTATLATAQSLYERSFISYPRTSSQKLPPSLGLSRIIAELARNPAYSEHAKRLIKEKRFAPTEGIKTDEAHPAIYPTGIQASGLSDVEERLYDLITRRFLSCFAPNAKVARTRVVVAMGQETYSANGAMILDKGWLAYYPFTTLSEKTLPQLKKGQKVSASSVDMREMMTQPPKRYSKAQLIAELERRNLGTKATRAAIIDTLFRRNYIEGTSINVTEFGMSVYETLNINANMIVNEETTKTLEEDMEQIVIGKKSEEEVIEEGKKMLIEALATFDKNKTNITEAMRKGLQASETLGPCPKDGGNLVIRRSRVGKFFAACANYPKCTTTFSVPQNAKIVPTGRVCEHCHTPIIKVVRRAKRPFEMDLDPNCITKKEWAKKGEGDAEGQVAAQVAQPATQMVSKPAEKPAVAAKPPAVKKAKAAAKPAKKATKKKVL